MQADRNPRECWNAGIINIVEAAEMDHHLSSKFRLKGSLLAYFRRALVTVPWEIRQLFAVPGAVMASKPRASAESPSKPSRADVMET
jgi:hypothetical protein